MFKEITASSIKIVDGSGKMRALIEYSDFAKTTILEMFDDDGLGRLQLTVDDRGQSAIRIMGRDGGNLVEVFAHGVPRHGIVVSGLGGEAAIVQVVHPDGKSQFEVFDK